MVKVHDATPYALWLDRMGPLDRRPPLDGDRRFDVAIIGGGYSALWTAYYLTELRPDLDVAVIEREHCGFGASGRNGGWCVGELAGPLSRYARRSSHEAAMRLVREVFASVDEVGRVAAAEGIDCDYQKGGWLRLARSGPQAKRQAAELEALRAEGYTEDEVRGVSVAEAEAMAGATEIRSAMHFAPTAAIDPAKLVVGLAATVEARGVTIFEETTVTGYGPGEVRTDRGTISADVVVQATEAYTRDLEGHKRDLLPVYSLMVATEPLDDAVMADIGLADRPTFSDDRHMVIYGQRTADNRLAFGGRGVPYLFGSKIDPRAELHERSHELIADTLIDIFPQLQGVRFTHRWGGVLGIPRNWLPSVRFDPGTRIGVLGGYVGEGVAPSNTAGRTLAELIVGEDSPRVELPWVDCTARRWEPEPFRWLGVRASRWLLGRADDREFATDREDRFATRVAGILRGD